MQSERSGIGNRRTLVDGVEEVVWRRKTVSGDFVVRDGVGLRPGRR